MTAHEDTPQDALSVFDFFEMLPDERAAIDQLCPWQEIQEGGQTLRKGEWLRGTLMPGKVLRTALVRSVVSGYPWVVSRPDFCSEGPAKRWQMRQLVVFASVFGLAKG